MQNTITFDLSALICTTIPILFFRTEVLMNLEKQEKSLWREKDRLEGFVIFNRWLNTGGDQQRNRVLLWFRSLESRLLCLYIKKIIKIVTIERKVTIETIDTRPVWRVCVVLSCENVHIRNNEYNAKQSENHDWHLQTSTRIGIVGLVVEKKSRPKTT